MVIGEPRRRAPIQPVARNFSPPAFADHNNDVGGKAAKIVEKHRRRIHRLVDEGRIRRAQRQAYTLFLSSCARIVAANCALKSFRPEPGMQRPSASQLAGLIFNQNASDDLAIKATPKASGGYRVICQYQLLDKARQHLVRLAYGALVAFADNQTGIPGAGIKAAVEKTRVHFRDTRLKYVIEADIKYCFDSVDVGQVRTHYGIPHWVMDHIITNKGKERDGKLHPRNTLTRREWNKIMIAIGHTLPQGSPASSILAFGFLQASVGGF